MSNLIENVLKYEFKSIERGPRRMDIRAQQFCCGFLFVFLNYVARLKRLNVILKNRLRKRKLIIILIKNV